MDYTQIQKDFESTINLIVESFEDAMSLHEGFKDLSIGYNPIVDHWYCKGKSPFSITKEERIKNLIHLANIYFIVRKPTPDTGGPSLFEWESKMEAKLVVLRAKQEMLLHTKSLLKKIESEGHKVWFELSLWDGAGDYHGHIRIH
jgi:hypothetical protein